ncbi:MAG: hypothetical protein JWP91_483 [Fibrobacteres bacterium]|nr:hypothetical protein [Fibrobacterota bacterium]
MSRNNLPASILAFACLALISCEFQSRRATWRLDSKVTYKIRYAAELRAKADGSWGSSPYVSAADAEFSGRAATDTGKGQIELSLAVDTVAYRSSERGPEEDRYMTGRLRKYRAKATLSRTGQVLALEEEPGLPPVEFTPLNFGRYLAYALPSFPDAPIKKGSRWETVQPLLDKFHPDSRVLKRFTLSAIRETPEGDLAVCSVEMEAFLDEDLGDGADTTKPSLTGRGQMVFNLGKGRPVSSELELEGRFMSRLPQKAGDSTQPEPLPLRLQEKVKLEFSE